MTIAGRARRWLERQGNFRIVAYCAAVGLATLMIARVAILAISSPPDPELSFSLSVRREPGRREASRCDDCTQPGDVVRARMNDADASDPGPRPIYGIRAYLDGESAAWCDDCASLGFAIRLLGRYEIVGVRTEAGCPLASGGGADSDLAKMTACGARLTSASRLEAR